jgi:hypothetical protein
MRVRLNSSHFIKKTHLHVVVEEIAPPRIGPRPIERAAGIPKSAAN